MVDKWEIYSARQNPSNGSILNVHFCIEDTVTGGCTKTNLDLDQSTVGAETFVAEPTRENLIAFVEANAKAMKGRAGVGDGSLWDYWRINRENHAEPTAREKAARNPVLYDKIEYDNIDSVVADDSQTLEPQTLRTRLNG